ncbi:Nitrate transporter 1.5 [Platanthera guangdongensis]|uniref:Nitrate transporter 1.5 n=1 Tax=Platanthera guangdongensis TaxID=2320717 RepID=A0ABR2MNG5_9ASPA
MEQGGEGDEVELGKTAAAHIGGVNQGLATLAFFGVGVNLVLFLTRVVGQNNADAANNVSKWTGTVYIFSLVGAFLSDSYWGRYKTCAVFQLIFVAMGLFSLSIYLVALGNGGYQPNIATFGADQFEEGDPNESHSKISFFSYFYLALNLGSLFSNTFLSYFEDEGMFLDRAALVTPSDDLPVDTTTHNPWRICTVTQVEEVKCVLRLLPIWLCTILYSVVFTQMASLFVEQGAAMNTVITGSFRIPPASMSAFDILSVSIFIFFYRRLLQPLIATLRRDPRGLTELHRMGLGLIIAIAAMIAAGIVEHFRLKSARTAAGSLNILWQVPQYMLIGASEVFMYVGQLEFFNEQAPDGLKSFGSALCMTSISLGNYASDLLVTAVMQITGKDDRTGWIPANLNRGHMDRFYFLLAALTGADLVLYVVCARCYKCIKIEER